MAKTGKIELIYTLTQTKVQPPSMKETARKDAWIKELQATVEADWKPLLVKVTYAMFNPEIEQLRKFFHTCVKYFAIQNMDMVEGTPDSKTLDKWREELLDELIGYDFQTVNKVIRKRPSTADYKETQPWLTLLNNFEETIFDSHGYEFPDSKVFWESVKVHGYEKAQDIAIKQLQERMKKRI